MTQALKFSIWFSTHFEIFDMVLNTCILKTKFQNVLKSVMHFENYVSTLLETLDMVFSMP